MQSSEATEAHSLSSVLAEIAETDGQIDELAARLDALKKRRAALELIAVEDISTQKLDGVRVAGRSWRVEECLYLSVPRDKRDEVLSAAKSIGIDDAITTVATTTLKSWLQERARESKKQCGVSYLEGTPFAGLVGEHSELKLRHVTVG